MTVGILLVLVIGIPAVELARTGRGRLELVGRFGTTSPHYYGSWMFGVSRDGRHVLLEDEGALRLIDAETQATLQSARLERNWGKSGYTPGMAVFSADGRSVILSEMGHDGIREVLRLSRWDLEKNELAHWGSFEKGTGRVALSPDNRLLATTKNFGSYLVVHDARTGAELRRAYPPDQRYTPYERVSIAWGLAGLMTLNLDALQVWDLNLAPVRSVALVIEKPSTVALTSRSSHALIGGETGEIEFVDLASSAVVSRSKLKSACMRVEISPDDVFDWSALVVTSDQVVHLLDLPSLREHASLPATRDLMTVAIFRPGTSELLVSHSLGSFERWRVH